MSDTLTKAKFDIKYQSSEVYEWNLDLQTFIVLYGENRLTYLRGKFSGNSSNSPKDSRNILRVKMTNRPISTFLKGENAKNFINGDVGQKTTRLAMIKS
jgi:hypothetical protein